MSLSATLSAAFDEHTGRLSEKRKRGQEEVAGKSAPLCPTRSWPPRHLAPDSPDGGFAVGAQVWSRPSSL